jgi:very-short-patch-repair endonuclease
MRRHSTLAEARLWRRLRHRQIEGLKFRRQHIIAGWIVDFYCPLLRLAVEVDGPHHDGQKAQDERRTRILADHGVQVVRVSAQAVLGRVDDVVESLRAVVVAIVNCRRP